MKTKYRNRKQLTKKKTRKNKTLKHKKSRKTRGFKRRSSKRRGGVRPSTSENLMKEFEELEGDPSLEPLFINTAYDSFIINPKAIVNIYGEGQLFDVTTYILRKFREFSSNNNLMEIMRIRNHQILTERTLDSDRDFIVLRHNHVDLGHAHEDFVNRIFQIASPFELRRGGAGPSTSEYLIGFLREIEGDPSLHPLFIDTAYNAFIINPKAIVKVDREGHWDGVTNYILDKFTEFSTNPDLLKIIKDFNEYLIEMLDSRLFIPFRQNRHPIHVNLVRRYDIFVRELFEIATNPL